MKFQIKLLQDFYLLKQPDKPIQNLFGSLFFRQNSNKFNFNHQTFIIQPADLHPGCCRKIVFVV